MFAQSDLSSVVNEWLGYMTEPDYVRVNGKPVLFVLVDRPEEAGLLQQLRATAVAEGLAGVYIVGGIGIPVSTIEPGSLAGGFGQARADGYDAVGLYNYPYSTTSVNGMAPFSALADIGHRIWNEATLSGALPFIPTAMAGWDPRPWNETQPITKDLIWYDRTPQGVATFLQEAIAWTAANPQLRPEPAPAPPLVLIEAWNEFGEGSHFIPNSGDGTSYGDAIAAASLAR